MLTPIVYHHHHHHEPLTPRCLGRQQRFSTFACPEPAPSINRVLHGFHLALNYPSPCYFLSSSLPFFVTRPVKCRSGDCLWFSPQNMSWPSPLTSRDYSIHIVLPASPKQFFVGDLPWPEYPRDSAKTCTNNLY